MKRIVLLALVGIMLGTTSSAWAQRGQGRGGRGGGGGRGGDPAGLLSIKSVQEDLKITEEQAQKITQLAEKQRAARGELRNLSQEERRTKSQEQAKETEKSVGEILTADQQKRAKQIGLQMRGTQALSSTEVAESLNLTAEQKDSIKSVQDAAGQEMRSLFQQGGGNSDENRKKFQDLRKSTQEKVMNLLTADQQSKWKEMVGEPFSGDLRGAFGGAGGGGRGRRGGGNGGGQGGQGRQRPARSNTT